ncbi:MAG: uL22 family ribosomal protein [Candidatus Nomurabacteria bacterium]|jgi:large subunit ribosomal protein L22|nr:uL22 family ribosomal protein [Candidatus Nomurabacteria bacterium]
MTEDYIKAVAVIKGVAEAPRKAAIVASLVRNRTVEDALVILENTPRHAAQPVKKAIQSAKANLLEKGSIDSTSIILSKISVTAGARMRRYKPASRGRALPFEKVSSNILIEVVGKKKVKKADANKQQPANKESK